MGDIVRRGTRDHPKYYGRYFESGRPAEDASAERRAAQERSASLLDSARAAREPGSGQGIVPLEPNRSGAAR